jgi:hypothetical protein
MNKQIQIVAVAVAALVLGGGGFVAGMTVGPTLTKTDTAAANASPGANAQGRQRVGGGQGGAAAAGALGQQVSGRVISVNDGSITIETRQPGSDTTRSTIALVGASARVVKTTETEIKLGDIKPGDQVLIVGTPDQTTGTVNASSVIVGINSLLQLFGGATGPGGGTGPGGQFVRPSGSPGVRPLPSVRPRP